MTETKEFIVFYDANEDGFLVSYGDRRTLAVKAIFSDDIEDALTMSVDKYLEEQERWDGFATFFKAKPVKVKATYELTNLDNSNFERTEKKGIDEGNLKALLDILAK